MTPYKSSFTPSSLSPLLLKTQSYICGQSKSDQLYVFDLLVTGKQSCSHRANCLWNLQVFFLFEDQNPFIGRERNESPNSCLMCLNESVHLLSLSLYL